MSGVQEYTHSITPRSIGEPVDDCLPDYRPLFGTERLLANSKKEMTRQNHDRQDSKAEIDSKSSISGDGWQIIAQRRIEQHVRFNCFHMYRLHNVTDEAYSVFGFENLTYFRFKKQKV